MRQVRIHNNLTGKKDLLQTQKTGVVHFYSCGPTTYDFAHVGNARAFVVGDLIHRCLKVLGYQVVFVRNFTDVDDKIIKAANEKKISAKEHADLFVKECLQDMNELKMLAPDHMPRVSECMPEIIEMIQKIIENGAGYKVDGEVFFHVPTKSDYGKLSKKDLQSLEHGKRVEVDQRKKHPADFVLWKPAKDGEPAWESPWGSGRPGWHIECSAMAKKYLGASIDLHHGGVDLMFPHHENEIAQSEAANQCSFCQQWVHNEFLNFGSEKMSKSLGNVLTIRQFTEKYSGLILRMILISVHYRAKLDWSEEIIAKAVNDLQRIHTFTQELNDFLAKSISVNGKDFTPQLKNYREKMLDFLASDFNSAGFLAEYFSLIRFVRREVLVGDVSVQSGEMLNELQQLLSDALGVLEEPREVLEKLAQLGRTQDSSLQEIEDKEIEKLLLQRAEAKKNKDYSKADEIRKHLSDQGVQVKDKPDGSWTWSR